MSLRRIRLPGNPRVSFPVPSLETGATLPKKTRPHLTKPRPALSPTIPSSSSFSVCCISRYDGMLGIFHALVILTLKASF